MEIGVSQGGSIQLWKKYFGDQLNIFAIDINPECRQFEEQDVRIFIGSQSDQAFLSDVAGQLPELDIVIDDGGHTMIQQKTAFETLFPKVKQGGIYIVEDTHTSYWYEFHGGLRKRSTFIEYSKALIDSLYDSHLPDKSGIRVDSLTRNINSIHFYDSMVVFEKRERGEVFHIRRGKQKFPDFKPDDLKKRTLLMRLRDRILGKRRHKFDENFKRESGSDIA